MGSCNHGRREDSLNIGVIRMTMTLKIGEQVRFEQVLVDCIPRCIVKGTRVVPIMVEDGYRFDARLELDVRDQLVGIRDTAIIHKGKIVAASAMECLEQRTSFSDDLGLRRILQYH